MLAIDLSSKRVPRLIRLIDPKESCKLVTIKEKEKVVVFCSKLH